MATATFTAGTKLSVETDRSSAPSAGRQANLPWWGGGNWFDVVTDGLPNIESRQATIFPAGHAGNRQINQQSPVVGRRWSDGDFNAPVVADYLGALLYATLGGLSTNMIPAGAPSLLNNESIQTNPKSLVLLNQPDFGGNVLRFDVKQIGAGMAAGATISISGIDAYGNGASELLSLGSTGLYWSRTSWSAIGASGIAVSGLSAASVTIFGVRRYEHLFFSASSAPTLSIERLGVPTAGAASKSHMHVGMLSKELTINTPAEDDEGIFNLSCSFEGDIAATSNSTSINAPSPLKIWPAWTLRITRDGGTTWYRPTEFNLTVNSGNRNVKQAAGAQGPQDKLAGGQEVTGNVTIYAVDELERNNWLGASRMLLYARWLTNWRLSATSTVSYELGASLPVYFEGDQDLGDNDGGYTLGGGFRGVVDAQVGGYSGQFALVNGTPGRSYTNGGVI